MRAVLLMAALAAVCAAADPKWGVAEEDDVAILTKENFDQFVKDHKFVFVKFYAPWCGHCKSMAPAYSKVARQLKEATNAIPIAKVDATVETELGERFGVKGFPTLKFFINGEPVDYNGGREEKDILTWIEKKSGPASSELKEDDFDTFSKKQVSGLFVFPEGDTKALEKFQALAAGFEDVPFAHTSSDALRSKLGVNKKYAFVLFRDFDDGKKILETDSFETDETKTFIDGLRFPLVMEFNQQAAERIFGGEKAAIIFFTDKPESSQADEFRKLAKSRKGEILFTLSRISQDLGARLAEFIGVTTSDENSVRIIKFQAGNLLKYKCPGIDHDSLDKCLTDYTAGKLNAYYKSEATPASNSEPVKVLTGNTFQELVIDSDKHVLVEVYAPWCGHCKKLAPIYDDLAKRLEKFDSIMIAKMDGTANEFAGLDVQGFPTLKFYKKGNKSKPMDFNGDRTVDGFIKFLEKETGLDLGKTGETPSSEEKIIDEGL